ncbi:MAG: GAF domain-containing protein [Caldilineaceae bacterium]|nr:GAF domain-containing protein [Caldilineaceae bacterium]
MAELKLKLPDLPSTFTSNFAPSLNLRGLRAKIIAWAFVPTAIILLAVAMVTYMAYRQVTEELVIGRDRELIRLSADQLISELTEYGNRLSSEARTDAMRATNDPEMLQQALVAARNRLIVFDGGVMIFDNFGRVVATQPERADIMGHSWLDRPYVRQMLLSPRTLYSDIVPDGPNGSNVLVVAVPIIGAQREFRGALAGMFHVKPDTVSSFYADILKLRMNQSGKAYLVDGSGQVIYHSDANQIGADFSASPIVQKVKLRQNDAIRTRDALDQDILAAYAPVPNTNWGLVAEESWEVLNQSSQGYRRFLALLLVLGFVVPSLFVAFGVRRITQPIQELIDAAQNVAAGNFDQQIRVRTDDEIAELARQFNHMSAQLQASYADMEQRVHDRTRELSTLYGIAQATSHSLDLDTVLSMSLERVIDVIEFDLGAIYLRDPLTGELSMIHERGMSERFRKATGRGILSVRVAETAIPIIIDNLDTYENPPENLTQEGYRSAAIIPLLSKQQVQGVLSAASRQPRTFKPQDVELLTSIGRQIGIAIENARLYETEQRRAEQFRVIGEMGRNITSILNVDDLLTQMTQLIQSTFNYYHVGIGLVVDQDIVYQVGAGTLWQESGHRFSPGRLKIGKEGISGMVAATGELYLAPDIDQEPSYIRLEGSRARSELVLPIKAKGQVIGVLDVQEDTINAFDDVEVTVLQSLANQAGVAIENARLYEQAQQLAVLEERQRLARDLHDSVTQALYGATLYAEAAARLLDAGNTQVAAEHLRNLRDTAHEALGEMRLLIFELRPSVLEAEGLAAALHARLEAVEGRTGLGTEITVEGIEKLAPDIEEGLYWICQEVLNNTLKHAKANHVKLALHLQPEERVVRLCIEDNGIGFDLETARRSGGWGLRGIEERVELMTGTLLIESAVNAGTKIHVKVPI